MAKKHNLQIIVTPKQMTKIRDMSLPLGISMGQLIRNLIETAHNHTEMHIPTCPDGQRCYVPQMHAAAADSAPKDSPEPTESPSPESLII